MLVARIDDELVLKAKVHSIFKNACNLVTIQDEFITILNSDRKIYPMSVVIDGKGNFDFTALNIVQGMEFILHKRRIYSVDAGIYIDVSKAKKWNSEPEFNFNPVSHSSIEKNIQSLERGINLYGKFSFIAPLVMYLGERYSCFNINIEVKEVLEEKYKFITERFYEFIDLVIQNDLDKISCSSKKLIGFGIGLTPSMDDFISGLMVSLVYLTRCYGFKTSEAYNLNSAIIRKGLEGTTRVSSEMLTFSSLGKSSQLVKNLIISLLGETEDYRILPKVKESIEVGETSGTDTILGIYVGFKIINNIKFTKK
jgi:Protein of unknown function (DUF2877).